MSVKDHKAVRPDHVGVPVGEGRGSGKTWAEVKGYPRSITGVSAIHGEPAYHSPGIVNVPVKTCLALTKAGKECKAKPVRFKDFCVGHGRQLESVLDD